MRGLSKWWQRWVLDALLTHPPPLVAVVTVIFLTVFAIGFWCAHWLDQVDLAVYQSLNVFSDNIKGENLLEKMSGILPIDVVYTWVNGSDPLLLEGLRALSGGFQDSCPLSHCLPAPYISLLNSTASKATLATIPSVVEVTHLLVTHNSRTRNFTVVRVAEEKDVATVMEKLLLFTGNTSRPRQAYWTSDVGGGWGMKQKHSVLVSGSKSIPPTALLELLFPHHKDITTMCSVDGTGSVQLVECREEGLVPPLLQADTHIEPTGNTTIRVRQAMLLLQPDKEDHLKEVDANRFEDNEELRYSLRSLEQNAPWVRRIFLVTNGQIPYWLNLDHPRLTIITHKEIFQNTSHLPTFSSPAIESHIHRIPGLSEHFLYMNDDVMLGSEIWPDDFFSPASGYKVYLSWSLPECSSGCPGSWLGDGYCDTSCNTSACEWDGGDCAGGELGDFDLLEGKDSTGMDSSAEFCAPSCSDLWLADRYCDHSCNIQPCGFDGGDCGLDKMELLHHLPAPSSLNTTYILPQGVVAAWMNLSSLLQGPGHRVEGWHSELPGIRTIAVNTAQKLLFILLKVNVTATIRIELNTTFKYTFVVECNTHPVDANNTKDTQPIVKTPLVDIKNFTFDRVAPKVSIRDAQQDKSEDWKYSLVNVNKSKLPQSLVIKILQLEASYRVGDISLNGLKRKKSQLIMEVLQTSTNHHLVYYTESEWPVGEEITNGDGKKNNFSHSEPDHLHLQEAKRRINLDSPTNNHKQQNINHQLLSSRSLLSVKSALQVGKYTADPGRDHSHLQTFRRKKLKFHEGDGENRVVVDNGTLATYLGSLPWEKKRLYPINNLEESPEETVKHSMLHPGQRHLLDMFAESLLHVNRLYNSEYGYQARRVPAHMPHFINKNVMEGLQERFKEEFQLTSSHKIRQANDMQYAFSYYFYLMSEKTVRPLLEVFKEFDTDNSGTLSDREIRTFLTFLHDLPLHYNFVQDFHHIVKNCSATYHTKEVPTPIYERYADSDLPTVSLELMLRCDPLSALLKKLEKVHKYKYVHLSDDVVHFKMVNSNVSIVIHMLDEVRKNKRKFICLNSNLDPRSKGNDLIHALVQDTYESLFPVPSSFELPLNYRNRFSYVEELAAWRKWRDFVRALIYACLASLVFLTVVNFFSTELEGLRRRWCRRRRWKDRFGGIKV